ncbi:uncharacterized protein A4U43_C07F20740 [Asparagus officinalis]|uniref:Non-haem dioxygenase N-terminal domain-containing protein n=1 Tax=Asparagus officinalis TaxID=4686 RepID=A0A5P1EDJ8_ASPOF|nr:uncharacterized protein A4U43_C07F20740 [Asparagus officinalis]
MVMDSGLAETKREEDEGKFVKGVRHLCESGITKVPHKYILPVPERPEPREEMISNPKLKLPIIDLALLDTPDRSQVLQTMANSCVEYGFFQGDSNFIRKANQFPLPPHVCNPQDYRSRQLYSLRF